MIIKCQITVLDSILKNQYRFNNQKISLMEIKYYNYFENITNKFNIGIKYKNKLILMTFENGSYNVSDINQIIDNTYSRKIQYNRKTNYNNSQILIDLLF